MAQKIDRTTILTTRSTQEIGRVLQDALADARPDAVEELQSASGALARFDERAEIEIVASGQAMIGGGWAVQVYVTDQGPRREIALCAVGDSGMTRALHGMRNTVSLAKSIAKRDIIATALRTRGVS